MDPGLDFEGCQSSGHGVALELDGVASDAYKCQGGDDRLPSCTGPGGSEGVGSCYGGLHR